MATKAKDNPTPGKELKKSTSAINTIPNHPRRLTKSSSTKSTTKPLSEHSSSSTSTKQIPNYLRPTLSASRHENALRPSSAGAKKHASNHPPTLNRRRSFDKPPSPSLLHKAIVSPGGDQTLRSSSSSSSFSSKSSSNSNVPRPGIERSNSKTSRAGNKPQPLPAKIVKKSNVSGESKKESSGGSTKAPRDITQTLNLEADLEAIESLSNQEVEEVGKIETEEHEKVVLPDPKIEENQESADAQVEGDSSANAEAEELKENMQPRIEESGNALGQDNDQHKVGEIQDNQNGSGEVQEQEETKVEVKEEEKESEKEENGEDKALHEKEVGEEVIEEGTTADAVEEAAKPPQQAAGGTQGGRKEAAPAYNDVIEETASKLLEKRKNKVKALVGAFETVIDYESGSK